LLLVTDGPRANRWFSPASAGCRPGVAVRAVVSTGAGDAFVGGLLHGLAADGIDDAALEALAGDDARRDSLLRFAAACGALAVGCVGSFTAMPDRDAVERFLETHAGMEAGTS
jgi:fructokinase